MLFVPRCAVAAAIALSVVHAIPAAAQEPTPIRFTLNWKLEGSNAAFFLAEEKGYFAAEKLKVTLDAGEGSSATVPRIASRAYDAGFGDLNALIEFNAKNPDLAQKAVYVLYNKPPLAIITLKKNGITKPADLIGRKVGAPASDTGYRMFPALAKAAGIDMTRITFQNISPSLRESLLVKGDVDAVTGFDSTSWFALKNIGVKREDVDIIYYSDFGIDVYSNAILASGALIRDKPEAVAGLVRAINKAWIETIKTPDQAIAILVKRDPLLNRAIELERLQWVIDNQIRTPETQANGLGAVDPARLVRSVEILAQSFDLPRKPAPAEIVAEQFLPPRSERALP